MEQIGVFYRRDDYIGAGKRLLIDFVDTVVATGVSVLISAALIVLVPDDNVVYAGIALTWVVIWLAYFVLLKRSRFRTLGYLIMGARVVNLRGERPSVASLLARLLFVVGGPANFLIDLFWITSDPCRQAIRDKFAHTYVVRNAAAPLGTGKIVYRTYAMFGTMFLFQEVAGAVDPND
jgi:uncharacterized RDD family membrane protein YckC